jgi:general bacterial porin, GBP family
MQVKLIALAVAGLIAAPAFAQSNVTVYGRISMGAQAFSNDDNGFRLGPESGNRLGFMGTEDLGGGLKAFFQLEHRFQTDTGQVNGADPTNSANNGVFWGERAWVGLSHDKAGSITLGRIFSPAYSMYGPMDAFGGDTIVATNWGRRGRISNYFNNGARYDSASIAGMKFIAAISTGEGLGNNTTSQAAQGSATSANGVAAASQAKKAYGFGLTGKWGKFDLHASWQHDLSADNGRAGANNAGGTIAAASINNAYNTIGLGVAYDFGTAKVFAVGSRSKGFDVYGSAATPLTFNSGSKQLQWQVGSIIDLGKGSLRVQYGQKRDTWRTGTATVFSTLSEPYVKQLGVGYWYDLSKRTVLMANVAFAKQKLATPNRAAVGFVGGTKSSQNGLELAVRHSF